MKYYLSVIALLTFTFLLQSGLGASPKALSAGDRAPMATLSNPTSTITLGDESGCRMLVAFWSVSDAGSRSDLARYSAYLAAHEASTRLTAICLDGDAELAREVARRDGVDTASVFVTSPQQAQELARGYGLEGSYGALLIGPDGRIETFNPAVELL